MPERETKTIAPPSAVLRLYYRYTRRHPWLLIGTLCGMLLIQASNLAAPLFLREFFNLLASGVRSDAVVHSLFLTLIGVGVVWLINVGANRLQDTAEMYLDSRVRAELMTGAFKYLIGHSYEFFLSNFAGSLTARVGKYARAYDQLFTTIVTQLAPTAVFVLGAIVVLFFRNRLLGAVLLAWSLGFIFFQIWVAQKRQPLRNERAHADTAVTAALADAIGNQPTITQFGGAAHEQRRFTAAVITWRDLAWRLWSFDSFVWGVSGLFTVAIEWGLLYAALLYWRAGALTIGDFVLIQSYLLTTIWQLVGINRQIRNFYDALTDAGEMIAILETPHEVQDRPGAKPLAVSQGAIAFKDVDFRFNDTRAVLDDFSLSIQGGEKVALVGPSGAGKSTITKLLLRLYDVSGGAIEIDGQNIAHATQESVRNTIAFVPQEPILFHRTLMENIRYGRRDASDEEVVEAAKKAHCHEFIAELQDGYDTYVGERGVKLSGGERQRVAIARAILKNAPILVLDEATSSLDSESEQLIQDALATLMEGKTVMVIAHRLSTIMRMDRIVVLERGKIVDQGSHNELLAREGLYKKLWSIQAGGFLIDKEDFEELNKDQGEVAILLEELEEEISGKESEHGPRG